MNSSALTQKPKLGDTFVKIVKANLNGMGPDAVLNILGCPEIDKAQKRDIAEMYERGKDSLNAGRVYAQIGDKEAVLRCARQLMGEVSTIAAAAELYSLIGEKILTAEAYSMIGDADYTKRAAKLYSESGEHTKSAELYEKAAGDHIKQKNEHEALNCKFLAALSYVKAKNEKKAFEIATYMERYPNYGCVDEWITTTYALKIYHKAGETSHAKRMLDALDGVYLRNKGLILEQGRNSGTSLHAGLKLVILHEAIEGKSSVLALQFEKKAPGISAYDYFKSRNDNEGMLLAAEREMKEGLFSTAAEHLIELGKTENFENYAKTAEDAGKFESAAFMYETIGNLDKAVENYKKAIPQRIDSKYMGTEPIELAKKAIELLLKANRKDEAEDVIRHYRDSMKGSGQFRESTNVGHFIAMMEFNTMQLYLALGNKEKAIEIGNGIKPTSEYFDVYTSVAETFLEMGEKILAAQMFEDMGKRTGSIEWYNKAAQIYARLGNTEKTMECFILAGNLDDAMSLFTLKFTTED